MSPPFRGGRNYHGKRKETGGEESRPEKRGRCENLSYRQARFRWEVAGQACRCEDRNQAFRYASRGDRLRSEDGEEPKSQHPGPFDEGQDAESLRRTRQEQAASYN